MSLGQLTRSIRKLLWILSVLATLLLAGRASSDTNKAVTLVYFRGTGQENAVLLEWATETQFNTAGFRLERATSDAGPFVPLDAIGIIPAVYDIFGGSEYEAIDDDGIINGNTYWYKLIEIEVDDNEIPTDPIMVVAGTGSTEPTETSTATATATVNVGANVTAETANSTPTSTSTPTLMSTNQFTQLTASPTVTVATFPPLRQATSTAPASSEELLISPEPDSGNIGNENVLAQLATVTPPSGYPVQPLVTPAPSVAVDTPDSFYPAATEIVPFPQTTIFPAEIPIPDTDFQMSNGNPSPITGQQQVESTGSPLGEQNVSQGASIVFLWLGFLAALTIFLTGVYASIIYFTRRRSREK